ncbi:hypothetical protein Lal_00021122 [Lupinus albus]|nr:hypothetical protein Lal_00021122 [Lupinus albus]
MIAIPAFAARAIENYGLVTYRETVLLYGDLLSLSPSTMPQLSTWSGHANMVQPPSQPNTTIAMFHHLDAPTWVTS